MYLLQAMISVVFLLKTQQKTENQQVRTIGACTKSKKKNPQKYKNFFSVFYCGICCGLLGVVKIMIYNHTRDGHYEPSRNVGICVFFFKILFFIFFFRGEITKHKKHHEYNFKTSNTNQKQEKNITERYQ